MKRIRKLFFLSLKVIMPWVFLLIVLVLWQRQTIRELFNVMIKLVVIP